MDKKKYIEEKFDNDINLEIDPMTFFKELMSNEITVEDVQKYRPQYYMYTQEMYDIINDNTSRPKEDLINYEQELFDRLWYLRTIHGHPELSNFPKAIEVIEKYGEPDDSLDWNYNFISGALATIRWSLNKYDDNKHFLDT